MLTRALAFALIALSLCGAANAKAHRGHRPRETKIFAAKKWSVKLENEVAESMGAYRYFTQAQVDTAVQDGTLEHIYCLCIVSPKLPMNRRYALPVTVAFVDTLSREFYGQFHQPLMIDSAIRAATTQRGLHLRNAAPAYGERASSHERGTTVDISKHLTRTQQQWLVTRLLYHYVLGRVLVIQERSCFHIFVRGDSNDSEQTGTRATNFPEVL
jgi:hypothetical protein